MEMNDESYHCHDLQFSSCCVALMTLKCDTDVGYFVKKTISDTDVGYFVKKLFLILMLVILLNYF